MANNQEKESEFSGFEPVEERPAKPSKPVEGVKRPPGKVPIPLEKGGFLMGAKITIVLGVLLGAVVLAGGYIYYAKNKDLQTMEKKYEVQLTERQDLVDSAQTEQEKKEQAWAKKHQELKDQMDDLIKQAKSKEEELTKELNEAVADKESAQEEVANYIDELEELLDKSQEQQAETKEKINTLAVGMDAIENRLVKAVEGLTTLRAEHDILANDNVALYDKNAVLQKENDRLHGENTRLKKMLEEKPQPDEPKEPDDQ